MEDCLSRRTQLRLAVEERLGRLCAEYQVLERPLYDSSREAIQKTRTYSRHRWPHLS